MLAIERLRRLTRRSLAQLSGAWRRLPLPEAIRSRPLAASGAVFGVLVVAFVVFVANVLSGLPSVGEIQNRQVAQSTKILDRTGRVVLYELSGDERRTVVPLGDIPSHLKQATLAVEDQHFYEESAVSVRGILRAVFANLLHGRVVQGGSTITQQLARNAFLTLDRTPTRKLKELIVALRIDQLYNKDQILELYLNEIPYGPNVYGAESASRAYFGKSAKDLSLAESAVLAALPKAPSYYSPWGTHTKELMARQRVVLKKMLDLGVVSQQDYDTALVAPISFVPQRDQIMAPHFVFAVQDYLVKKYGEELIREGGLRVITTLDTGLQTIAERVVREGADRNSQLYEGKNAALVAEDPKTGQILAMVGSRDFFDQEHDGNFNVATQGLRQPGSAFKPFVYLTAFERGFTPDTALFDVPTEFVPNNPSCPAIPNYASENARCFHPENFSDAFAGPVSMRNALAHSLNIPAVKTLYLAGITNTLATLSDFGITTLTDPRRYGLSLVLGGGEIKLVELAGAYATLATDGMRHERATVLEVQNAKGEIIEQFRDVTARAVNPQYARLVTNILSDVGARAGLFGASLGLTTFDGREVALKTGTTNNYRDAWTFGYTPSLVVGVWAGNNDNTPMQKRGSSILAALPIWSAFMKEAINSFPVEYFDRPAPTNPEKPVLRGDYLWNKQIHSILYYVNKNDPDGPIPLNPEDDPQFYNWEQGVLVWAASNIPDFASYNNPNATSSIQNASGTAPLGVSVRIDSPTLGSFVDSAGFDVRGQIDAGEPLSAVRVYVNGRLTVEFSGSYPPSYPFSVRIAPSNLALQNLIEVEAASQSGRVGRASVIVYH